MKQCKIATLLGLTLVVSMFFLSCNTSKTTIKNSNIVVQNSKSTDLPFNIEQTYINRVSAKDSKIQIHFKNLINIANFKLKNVYFRGMIGEILSGKSNYFAHLKANKYNLIMSNEPNGEFGNTLPPKAAPFPFKLKDNQCIISYIDNGEIKYFQINNVINKPE